MQPAGVNMTPILQALARRQQGAPSPMLAQQTTAPPVPQATPASMPNQVQQGAPGGEATTKALNAGQQAQGPQFDPETRDLAKSLVQRLLKGL